MTTIISFIIVIGIIVFVHEFGHFLAAKLSGVRVDTFSLGFPPKMFGRVIGETEYQICWVPLGGYVKMAGMADESFNDEVDQGDPRGFMAQSFGNKALIISAGVIMNMILAFILYTLVTWSEGVAVVTGTEISEVSPDYPAAEAGIASGDKIVEVDGVEVLAWEELTGVIRENPGLPIEIRWQRGDSSFAATITPKPLPEFNIDEGKIDTIGVIGVLGEYETEAVSPVEAAFYGAAKVYWVLKLNVVSLRALLTGRAHIRELTGPLGIAKLSGQSARSGVSAFVSFIALISVSIGFLNILPIPMLDGGHLVFTIIEASIGKPISAKLKMTLMKVGLAALLLLLIVVSYNDIIRFYFGN